MSLITKIRKKIGKNCRYNMEAVKFFGENRKRRLFYCVLNNKICGKNTICKNIDSDGKKRFDYA